MIASSLCLEAVIEDFVLKFIQKNHMNVRSGKGVWDVMQIATKQMAIVSIGKQRAQKWLVVGNRANMEDFFVDVFQSLIIFSSPWKISSIQRKNLLEPYGFVVDSSHVICMRLV